MAKRKRKMVSFRGPPLKITKKGPKLQMPSARIGGKAGVNIRKSGVSGSVRTGAGSFNTKRGLTLNPAKLLKGSRRPKKQSSGCALPGCSILSVLVFLIIAIIVIL